MPSEPLVSIVIPTFNRASTVGRAVQSCLANHAVTIEVVVVDDGSTDDTRAALAQALAPPQVTGGANPRFVSGPREGQRLRYVFQPHAGAPAARNRGLDLAAGEYVKFLDSDDELIPGALAAEVRAAQETNADAVVTGWEEREASSEATATSAPARRQPAPDLANGIDDMLQGRAPWTAAALYRRAFIRNLRWDEQIEKAQDWDWAWTVCLARAHFHRLDIPSAVYIHRTGARVSGHGNAFLRSTLARQRILAKVEDALRRQKALTPERSRRLAQYYCKDSKILRERWPADWQRMWARCQALAPGFVPDDPDPAARFLMRVLGVPRGTTAFVQLRRVARAWGIRR